MSRVNFFWWVILGWGLIITGMLISLLFQFMTDNIEYKRLIIGPAEVKVEIADDVSEQYKGLSGRASLPKNTGLLFIYKQPTNHNFWMQGMRFALDFIWIANNQVIQIDENIPPPTTSANEPVRIYPRERYNMVLEVPAGWVKSNNIKVGDKVDLE